MRYNGKTPEFFQATVGGFTKPGKIGEVALQVRQLQTWANKIQQSGRIAEHSRRCDRTRWEMMMTKRPYWLAGPMRDMNRDERTNDGKARDGCMEGN